MVWGSYLKFWFWIDLMGAFPWSIGFRYQSVKLIGLIKLLRIFSLRGVFERLNKIQPRTLAWVRFLFICVFYLFYVNIVGCLWFLVSKSGTLPIMSEYVPATKYYDDAGFFEQYSVAVYFAAVTISTTGY
eukprot:Pgem_evm1s9763